MNKHIAYCFTCAGRSLPPEEQAALVLREVSGMKNREAAIALNLSEPMLRHRLDNARKVMQANFEGLCNLINKNGICYQCRGLRERVSADKQGPNIPVINNLNERLKKVRHADIDQGLSQTLHDLF